jgi:hypothetical protein
MPTTTIVMRPGSPRLRVGEVHKVVEEERAPAREEQPVVSEAEEHQGQGERTEVVDRHEGAHQYLRSRHRDGYSGEMRRRRKERGARSLGNV